MHVYIFHNRPMALVCTLFAGFSVMSFWMCAETKRYLMLVCSVLLVALTVCLLLRRGRGRYTVGSLLCLLAVLLSIGSSYLFFDLRYGAWQARNGMPCTLEGRVEEFIGGTAYSAAYRVRIDRVNGKSCSAGAMLECEFSATLQRGDLICVTAVPRAFEENEYFDEASYRLSDGCLTVLTCHSADDCEVTGRDTAVPRLFFDALNAKLAYRLRNAVGGEAGGIAAALLLGNRTWLTADTVADFQRAGISHLLALSGLHVSILIGFLELVLRRLRVARIFRAVLIPLSAIGYLAVTGFAVSTCRAVFMICVLYLAFLLRAGYDPLTALCTVLAALLLITPYAVLDLSLWLSFLAAASILIFSPAFSTLLWSQKWARYLPKPLKKTLFSILGAIFTGVVANLAILLLNAAVFGELSLASVPATLVLAIPVTLLLVVAALALLCPVFPFLQFLCAYLGDAILSIAAHMADAEGIMLPVSAPLPMMCIALLTAALILLAILPLRKRLWALTVPILLVAVLVSSQLSTQSMEPAVYTFQTGNGEVRLYTERGRAIAVNDTSGAATASYQIKTAATREHCTELEGLVLSRYYNQATYFIAKVAERNCVLVLHLPIPTDDRERAIAARLAAEAELHGIRVTYDAEEMLERYDTARPCE